MGQERKMLWRKQREIAGVKEPYFKPRPGMPGSEENPMPQQLEQYIQPENPTENAEDNTDSNIDFTRTQDNDLADNFCTTDVAGPAIPDHLKNLPEKDENKDKKTDLEKQKDEKVFAKVFDPFANIHKEDMNLKTEEEK